MFWQRRADKAARVGHWKWVESARGNGLFDLSNDIGETTNLLASHRKKLAELSRSSPPGARKRTPPSRAARSATFEVAGTPVSASPNNRGAAANT